MSYVDSYDYCDDYNRYNNEALDANICYDTFVRSCETQWHVLIEGESHFFPYSLCVIDEISNVILCPMWFVLDNQLEAFIDE